VGPTCQTPCAAPGPRGSALLLRGCHAPRRSCVPKAPPRQCPPPPPRPSHRRPDCLVLHVARLADRTAVPTFTVRSRRRRPSPCRSPIDVAPCRRPRVGEPPVPRSSPVRRCRAAVGSPSSAAVRCALRGPAELGRTPCAGRAPSWPRAVPALCDWAERGFGPVAPGLNFIFSEYIQFIAISKNCVGFI
jgi:hypothetical protein